MKAIEAERSPPYTMSAALRSVGYSESMALHHASRIFDDPRVRRLLKALDDQGMERFLAKLNEQNKLR